MGIYSGERLSPTEKQAFIESLYREHFDILTRYVFNMVGSRMLAEDIVQDTFCEAVKAADKLYGHPNKGGWLMKTAKNKMKEARRKAGPEGLLSVDDFLPELMDMEEKYSLVELNIIMDNIFNEHERRLFRMYYIMGYTAKELAKIENITESNLKVRMHRLRKRLLEKVGVFCLIFLMGFCFWLNGM